MSHRIVIGENTIYETYIKMEDNIKINFNIIGCVYVDWIQLACHYKHSNEPSNPHRWCLHLVVVVGFEYSRDPESYAGGSIATGRGTHAGQVKV
jgi:hypothetical protein